MAASGDITIAQDGGQGNVKLHPYLVTLVRWCVSCLWSTATVLLHRLMTTQLQPITGPKPQPVPKAKVTKRAAGTEHLHPEPTVECQVLHQPTQHAMDVIFVHGLYGSLGNTWRQGDWRPKYKNEPQKVILRNHSTTPCNCHENSYNNLIYNENKCDNIELNDPEMSLKKINEKLSKKVIPKENELITEQFYNNTLMDQIEIIDNYDTQAKFVSDLFKKENCDNGCDDKQNNREKYNQATDNGYKCNYNENNCNYDENNCNYSDNNGYDSEYNQDNDFKCKYNEINKLNECKCNFNEKKCEMGCGCLCNDCYSICWPKDWIKVDYPGARVISINYTSDPYLWRPLWIKENKRLNLYQRADQMIEQLLEMGVGEKPIIWVGHSKGGLFIKQIYCEAYEAYKKISKNSTNEHNIGTNNIQTSNETLNNGITAENIDTIIGHFSHNEDTNNIVNCTGNNDNYMGNHDNCDRNSDNSTGDSDNSLGTSANVNYMRNNDNIANSNTCVMDETVPYNNIFQEINENVAKNKTLKTNNDNLEYVNNDNVCNMRNGNGKYEKITKDIDVENGKEDTLTSSIEESSGSIRRASLWSSSKGFMFYSVPHRGSPLADIKTPVTARSVDLLEIAKDCPLVLELQERWVRATGGQGGDVGGQGGDVGGQGGDVGGQGANVMGQGDYVGGQGGDLGGQGSGGGSRVAVRSFVETCRTLMSVLWLRIVSTESADAGIGTLYGISVDHREICKPSSRTCLLYTELKDLINEALKCRCQ